jgi:hypothetical protein
VTPVGPNLTHIKILESFMDLSGFACSCSIYFYHSPCLLCSFTSYTFSFHFSTGCCNFFLIPEDLYFC